MQCRTVQWAFEHFSIAQWGQRRVEEQVVDIELSQITVGHNNALFPAFLGLCMMLPALNGADDVRIMLSIDTFFFLHVQILLGMTILAVILIWLRGFVGVT